MNIFSELETLKSGLSEEGFSEEVYLIDDAIASGSTSTEIYILVKGALKKILKSNLLNSGLSRRVLNLVVDIETVVK
jgi:hypothetical protein